MKTAVAAVAMCDAHERRTQMRLNAEQKEDLRFAIMQALHGKLCQDDEFWATKTPDKVKSIAYQINKDNSGYVDFEVSESHVRTQLKKLGDEGKVKDVSYRMNEARYKVVTKEDRAKARKRKKARAERAKIEKKFRDVGLDPEHSGDGLSFDMKDLREMATWLD
jgi:DNA-binding transcriptional ArsR family regulator